MGIKTEIAWCDSTVNPVMGCDGCELSGGHCYAESLVTRYADLKGWPKAFAQPEFVNTIRRLDAAVAWPDLTGAERPDKPWLNGLPRMIFVCDLADPFTESLPIDWLSPHVDRWKDTPHVWMLLTKRPDRMGQFVAEWQKQYHERFPQNVWGGTSVTSQATAWRIGELLKVPSLAVRFVSLEPLLESVDLGQWLQLGRCRSRFKGLRCGLPDGHSGRHSALMESVAPWWGLHKLHWVIVGGESGHKARPMHPAWPRAIRNQCQAAGAPFFFKQQGEWMPFGDPDEIADLPHSTPVCLVKRAGEVVRPYCDLDGPGQQMIRVGKKRAGRLLDGREWNEIPQVSGLKSQASNGPHQHLEAGP